MAQGLSCHGKMLISYQQVMGIKTALLTTCIRLYCSSSKSRMQDRLEFTELYGMYSAATSPVERDALRNEMLQRFSSHYDAASKSVAWVRLKNRAYKLGATAMSNFWTPEVSGHRILATDLMGLRALCFN